MFILNFFFITVMLLLLKILVYALEFFLKLCAIKKKKKASADLDLETRNFGVRLSREETNVSPLPFVFLQTVSLYSW